MSGLCQAEACEACGRPRLVAKLAGFMRQAQGLLVEESSSLSGPLPVTGSLG